jgi:hypothetical protein
LRAWDVIENNGGISCTRNTSTNISTKWFEKNFIVLRDVSEREFPFEAKDVVAAS